MFAFVGATWIGGWSASKIYTTNANLTVSHEMRIANVEIEQKNYDKRLDSIEKRYIKQDVVQEALLKALEKLQDSRGDDTAWKMKTSKEISEIAAWIKVRGK